MRQESSHNLAQAPTAQSVAGNSCLLGLAETSSTERAVRSIGRTQKPVGADITPLLQEPSKLSGMKEAGGQLYLKNFIKPERSEPCLNQILQFEAQVSNEFILEKGKGTFMSP